MVRDNNKQPSTRSNPQQWAARKQLATNNPQQPSARNQQPETTHNLQPTTRNELATTNAHAHAQAHAHCPRPRPRPRPRPLPTPTPTPHAPTPDPCPHKGCFPTSELRGGGRNACFRDTRNANVAKKRRTAPFFKIGGEEVKHLKANKSN